MRNKNMRQFRAVAIIQATLFVVGLGVLAGAPPVQAQDAAPTVTTTEVVPVPAAVPPETAIPGPSLTPDASKPAPGVVAPPAAEAPQTWWQALLFDLIKLTLAIFGPVLSVLGVLVLRKMGIEVDLRTMDKVAREAALYAEHKAGVAFKEGAEKSAGAKKEEWAWEFVKDVDERFVLSDKLKRKVRGLILAKIPEAERMVNGVAKDEG